MSDDVKYPDVTVQLSGQDGNVFIVIGAVSKALRKWISAEAATEWVNAAMNCGSYDEVLQLAMSTVNVE